MAKKYNNSSNLLRDWTTQKLKSTFLSCQSSILADCFSTHDLLEKEAIQVELEHRGYEIRESLPTIVKAA